MNDSEGGFDREEAVLNDSEGGSDDRKNIHDEELPNMHTGDVDLRIT